MELIQPWFCHLSVVFLVAFIVAKSVKKPVPAMLAALLAGVVFSGAVTAADLKPGGWVEAESYWKDNSKIAQALTRAFKGKTVREPGAATRGVVMFWAAPLIVAWMTVSLRSRKQEPGDQAFGPGGLAATSTDHCSWRESSTLK